MPAPSSPHARRNAAYRTAVLASHTLVRALGMRLRVSGAEHVPDEPCVVAFQHCSPVDGVVLGGVLDDLGHTSTVLLKKSVFATPVIGSLLSAAGGVPVDRFTGSGAGAFDLAAQRLREGRTILIAPEGGLSRSFTVMPMRTGAARLAHEAGVPIVPVVQVGLQRLGGLAGQSLRPRFRLPVDIRFGHALATTGDARADTDALSARMTALLAQAQDDYPDPGAGEWWWPAERGGSARGHDEEAAWHRGRYAPDAAAS